MIHPGFDNEVELIKSLHEGNHDAFAAVYHRLHARLYFFALRFVSQKDAEDIIADSFIKLWHKKELFPSVDDISAYLHVLVRNRCYNQIRDLKLRNNKQLELLRRLEIQEKEDHLLEQVRIELVETIYQQIEKLPARMREIFLLSYREGLKPAEIAERLEISVQTVSNQKLTAVKLLRAMLVQQNKLGILLLLLQLEYGFGLT